MESLRNRASEAIAFAGATLALAACSPTTQPEPAVPTTEVTIPPVVRSRLLGVKVLDSEPQTEFAIQSSARDFAEEVCARQQGYLVCAQEESDLREKLVERLNLKIRRECIMQTSACVDDVMARVFNGEADYIRYQYVQSACDVVWHSCIVNQLEAIQRQQ